MTNEVLRQLASTGIVGVILVLALLALRAKDKELQGEKAARIEDSEKMLTLALNLQEKVIAAVNELSKLVQIWERREADRERDERSRREVKR